MLRFTVIESRSETGVTPRGTSRGSERSLYFVDGAKGLRGRRVRHQVPTSTLHGLASSSRSMRHSQWPRGRRTVTMCMTTPPMRMDLSR
jgi:hypothetical protein